MTTTLFLSLGAAALWGGADFLAGLTSRRLDALTVVLWAYIAGGVAATAVALATGAQISGTGIAWSVVAGAVGAIGLGVFYAALAAGTMSIVAPISACGAIVPVIAALAAGESTSAITGAGMALALGGAVLASRPADEPEAGAAHAPRDPRRAIVLSVVAAVLIGGVLALMQQATAAAGTDPLAVTAVARLSGIALLVAVVSARRKNPGVPRADWRAVGFVGLADTAANGLFVVASDGGHDAVAAVLASLYPVITVILARTLLGERLGRVQALGVLVALLGVALVAAR